MVPFAMGARMSQLVRSHYLEPSEWDPVAVLVWNDAPPPRENPELLWVTQGNLRLDAPASDPEVFRLEKHVGQLNAFALGITLGRTQNNDVMLDHDSVSRFHAYFQQDPHSGVWHVVDAESSNGTFLEGVRLAPKRPAPLVDRARMKFGHVEVQFFSPAAFGQLLDDKVNPGKARPSRSR